MTRIALVFALAWVGLGSACSIDPPPTGESEAALGTLSWPASQVFPSFAAPATLDVVSTGGKPGDQLALLASLEGVVNRTRPRIYLSGGSYTDNLWLSELGVPSSAVSDPFALVAKYRSELAGIVIYDDAQADTVNLATTIAGLQNGVVSSPALAPTLTAAPYNLPVLVDLRANHFANKLAVYQYELDHYAAQANHRLIVGLTPDIKGNLRDYAVATQAMMVWLDPRNGDENALLKKFFALLPHNAPYLGWWLDEPAGVKAAAAYGVPVYAADWSSNLTVLGGAPRGIQVPQPPPPPPLENKIYVAIFMSDGDNLQEDQGLIPLKWSDGARGQVPISWTVNPALVDVAPGILRYFYRTATPNDVLVSGPSGLGYTYPSAWPSGGFVDYTRVSGQYLQAAGLRVVTLWNNGADLSDTDAHNYRVNAPGLVGMTIQDSSQVVKLIDGYLPLQRFQLSYGDNEQILEGGIDAQLGQYNGQAPVFIAVQGNMNHGEINPSAFARVQARYANNRNIQFVRGDHFFQLLEKAKRPPGHRLFAGDWNGDGKTDQLMYYHGNGDFWMGLSDGNTLSWHRAANVAGFGGLLDGRHSFYTGDFTGDGKDDLLFYFKGDGNWWLGVSDGSSLSFHVAANTRNFGDVLDGKHRIVTGDYDGDGKTDVMFYYSGDGNVWIGRSNGDTLEWRGAGGISGFGNLLDGAHVLFDGDFDGDRKTDLLFYYAGNGDWWLGHSNGSTFDFRGAGNTSNFGNLASGDHGLWSGDFDGDGKQDLAFHYAGNGDWWLGKSNGNGFGWSRAGNTGGLGEAWLDWYHHVTVIDADGDRRADLAAYDSASGDWWIGHSSGSALTFTPAGNVRGFGDLYDPSRLVWLGDWDGDGKEEPLFYYNGDGNWWAARSDGSSFGWRWSGNTAGFGDLIH